MATTIFEIGEKWGFLTIVAELPRGPGYRRRYLARCFCGAETSVRGDQLRPGRIVSCGCYGRRAAALGASRHNSTHGETRGGMTAEYRCWTAMKTRCGNPNHKHFKHYGGRGITIIPRWLNSYQAFLSDMGRKPSPAHSIDRISNDLGYFPANCRWSTASEQNNNRRKRRSLANG
jgi:hypothetical protein